MNAVAESRTTDRRLRSANGRAFSASGRMGDTARSVRLARPNPMGRWFLGALAVFAALFFLLGVDGAEKRLGSAPADADRHVSADNGLF